nr:transposase [Parafrankia soli]
MALLADQIDGVIGVDTHRDTLAAAAVTPVGAVLVSADAPANADGYQRLLELARQHVPGRRCWALEGTGSYGAGLAGFLDAAGECVVEVCRPKRPVHRGGRKTDALDAVRAAREALVSDHLIHPRRRGEREALRVLLATRGAAVLARTAAINQLKALIVSAPEALRAQLRGRTGKQQIAACLTQVACSTEDVEHRMTVRALRCTAQRIQTLTAEAKELEKEIHLLVQAMARAVGTGRSRADQRGAGPCRLVAPRAVPFRRGVRRVRWRRSDPRFLWPHHPLPAQPSRGPPAEQGTPHDRSRPGPSRPGDPGLHREADR